MTPNDSGGSATNPNSGRGKTIPEMTWDEILALPSRPLSLEEMKQEMLERTKGEGGEKQQDTTEIP
jgi:hypothetical protein